jgi:hypothetical protein
VRSRRREDLWMTEGVDGHGGEDRQNRRVDSALRQNIRTNTNKIGKGTYNDEKFFVSLELHRTIPVPRRRSPQNLVSSKRIQKKNAPAIIAVLLLNPRTTKTMSHITNE